MPAYPLNFDATVFEAALAADMYQYLLGQLPDVLREGVLPSISASRSIGLPRSIPVDRRESPIVWAFEDSKFRYSLCID